MLHHMQTQAAPSFFKARRDALMARAAKAHPGAAFIFFGGREKYRNIDVDYAFRQDSNFWYLTGFEEPEAYLVLSPKVGGAPGAYVSTLFVRARDVSAEIWTGERYGPDRVPGIFGVDAAYPLSDLDAKLPELLKPAERVFFRVGPGMLHDAESEQKVLNTLEAVRKLTGRSGRGILPLLDPAEFLGELRLFKAPEEIDFQRKACEISAAAHTTLMKTVKPGWNEAEVEALVDYEMRRKGCRRMGYGSIIAGGKNACCLHYRENNEALRDGDVILIDAGGEYEYYTGDITRTWPVGRTFSKPQAVIYDLVLKAQKAVIDICKPGTRYTDMYKVGAEVMAEGLLSLGILKGTVADAISSGQMKRFFPHGMGHWLGMDVHDVGPYQIKGEARLLEPGMCFTVEPGLYFQPFDTAGVPSEYVGVGVRIEDNILITANGHENLTAAAPKERADIEALRAKA